MKQGQLTVSSGLKGRREGEDAHRCSPRPRRRSTCSRTPASMPARPRTLHSPSCACRWIPRRRVRTSGAGRRPRRRRAGRVRPGRWPAPSSCRADPSPRAHSARRRGGGRERRPRRPDLRATGASRAARGVRGSAALAAGSREGQSRTMSSSSSELLQSAAQDRRRASQRLSGGCRASTACGAAGSRPTGSRGEPCQARQRTATVSLAGQAQYIHSAASSARPVRAGPPPRLQSREQGRCWPGRARAPPCATVAGGCHRAMSALAS